MGLLSYHRCSYVPNKKYDSRIDKQTEGNRQVYIRLLLNGIYAPGPMKFHFDTFTFWVMFP